MQESVLYSSNQKVKILLPQRGVVLKWYLLCKSFKLFYQKLCLKAVAEAKPLNNVKSCRQPHSTKHYLTKEGWRWVLWFRPGSVRKDELSDPTSSEFHPASTAWLNW